MEALLEKLSKKGKNVKIVAENEDIATIGQQAASTSGSLNDRSPNKGPVSEIPFLILITATGNNSGRTIRLESLPVPL